MNLAHALQQRRSLLLAEKYGTDYRRYDLWGMGPSGPPPQDDTAPLDESLAIFRRLLARDAGRATRATVFYHLGLAYTSKGDLVAAADALRSAIDLAPESGRCHVMLGSVYLSQRQARDAVREANRGLELDKDDEMAQLILGDAWMVLGDRKKAIAAFTEATHSNYAPAEAWGTGMSHSFPCGPSSV
jgi:tetratricopeptide (TPR) repeat protein